MAAEGPAASDPAAKITAIEERLLQMAPTISEWSKALTADGMAAAAAKTHPGTPLIEPESLGPPDETRRLEAWDATISTWSAPAAPGRQFSPGNAEPLGWVSAFVPVTGITKIKTYDGELVPHGETYLFRTHHKILIGSAAGRPLASVTAEVKLDWGSDGSELRIIRWELVSAKVVSTSRTTPLVGTESLMEAIPDAGTYADLRDCRHESYLRAAFRHPGSLPEHGLPGFDLSGYSHTTYESTDQHPGVSVVDVDGDGFDDLYLTRRWGPNHLLINRGDGTFSEQAETFGLAFSDYNACSLFADFDNDGDQDVFVGRSLKRPILLENVDGIFRDVSHQVAGALLPYLTTSAAAADYDGDGLLDLYIGTYGGRVPGWKHEFLDPADVGEFTERAAGTNPFYDFAAAPNLLLRNTGNMKFERAPEDPDTRLWRATLQPTFADWDEDGDPDLLVTNDFGPDVMLRNDPGENGQRRFTDVTGEIAPAVATNYFGMGGSWGDYDGDSHLDLYLSAMYSKAGTRITNRLGDFQLRARQSALGSLLLAGGPEGSLRLTSGSGQGQHPVHQVGWSWGGQFFDPDNDGNLDLYAPTGYFTPPADLALEQDY